MRDRNQRFGQEQRVVWALNGDFGLAAPGSYRVVAAIDGVDSEWTAFSLGVRPPTGGQQVRQRHGRKRRLADPGRSADQDERSGHEPPAEHRVKLADAGLQPLVILPPDR